MLREPDVTLTDWALAVQATLLASWLWRGTPPSASRRWWMAFFASVAASALLGGLVHGVVPEAAPVSDVLWRATLLGIGVTTLAAWGAGAYALVSPHVARWIVGVATAVFFAYAVAVVIGPAGFGLAVAHYAPAAVFLLLVLARVAWRTGVRPVGLGALGLVVLLAGFGGAGAPDRGPPRVLHAQRRLPRDRDGRPRAPLSGGRLAGAAAIARLTRRRFLLGGAAVVGAPGCLGEPREPVALLEFPPASGPTTGRQ